MPVNNNEQHYYLFIEVPSYKNNYTMHIKNLSLADREGEDDIFKTWYKLIGEGCKNIETISTEDGIIFVDENGGYKPELTQSKITVDSREITLAGNMIIAKGNNSSGELEYFSEQDPKITNWMNIFQSGSYFNHTKRDKNTTVH